MDGSPVSFINPVILTTYFWCFSLVILIFMNYFLLNFAEKTNAKSSAQLTGKLVLYFTIY